MPDTGHSTLDTQPSFTDNQGREWTLFIDVNTARRVRRLCGVNILDIKEGLPQLAEDPILLVDALYVILKEQCDAREVTDEQFGAGLVGDAIDAAGDALVLALIEFFPEKKRVLLRQMLEATRELTRLLEKTAETKLPKALEQLRALTASSG